MKVSNILNIIQTYPASLNILGEAMNALYGRTPPWSSGDKILRWYFIGSDILANTLYSALSRHILRPTPYSAKDLPSQIREHIAATPRATKVLVLGDRILNTLVSFRTFDILPTEMMKLWYNQQAGRSRQVVYLDIYVLLGPEN